MLEIFADTSGWGHLFDPKQSFHLQAASIYRANRNRGNRIITTNYIIAELVAMMSSPLRLSRTEIVRFIESIKTSAFVDIVHIDIQLDQMAWQILKQHQDKDWSLTDCASFAVMKQRNITEVLTHDHHFEQYGFVRMLK